eukprot:CAMPEP_0116103234 /NCGR_PEP_ID=MMETSP0327-20121206/13774_1 /TAXON_ID=44447 /ORGANISM="Pseudo-nitzschia delicatissima, Strain B596" /LENGTH=239 /DNA_ID=CAMNT_0003595327 /DNA_START=76 /DNA_END=795 /DNA_ORIENTATION=-
MSLPFVALLLLLVSQASAFSGSSSSLTSQTSVLPTDSIDLHKNAQAEFDEDDEMEEWEDDEEEWEDDEEEEWEDDEEEDEEYEDDDWTLEQYEEMDRLFEKYLQELSRRYGDDWQEKFDLVVDREEVYENYLEFEERKQEEAEERRQLIEASHKALNQHNEYIVVDEDFSQSNQTEEAASVRSPIVSAELPSRTHMVVLNIDNKNKNDQNVKNAEQECVATTTIVTMQEGNTHTVIGSI